MKSTLPVDFDAILAIFTHPLVASSMGAIVGFFLQRTMQISTQRRKEYMEFVSPIRARLIAGKGSTTPNGKPLSAAELDVLNHYLGWMSRRRLASALAMYAKAHHENEHQDPRTKWSSLVYRDSEAVAKRLESVVEAIPFR